MDTPLISVILPVYNAEKYVKEAIESVLNQTYKHVEFLIINDGSTDTSKEIILQFDDPRIRYIENEQNIQLIKTLNKGIDLAKGKYIARMDADDRCSIHRFQKQIDFLERNPSYVLCGTWATIIDSNGTKTGRIKRIDSSALLKANMLFTTPFIHPSMMFRTEVLKNNQYSERAVHCEDLELWCRLATNPNYLFATIPEFLLDYRWHSTNVSVEHAAHQAQLRRTLMKPYIEILTGELSESNLNLHFSLFEYDVQMKHSNGRKQVKEWMNFLIQCNTRKKCYEDQSLRALLYSRWLVLALKNKSFRSIFQFPFRISFKVLFQALKLLLYK